MGAERRRKERLAFVNKSLSKALPTSSPKKSEKKKVEISSESETSSSDDSEDELLLPRRCRAQVNYNNTEYDDMLKKAIGIEPRPKVVKPVVVEEEEEESEEESEEEEEEEEKDSPGKPK